jgi:hypothetical protein
MTLADVTFPVSYEWGRAHALLFSVAMAARLGQLHTQYGRPDCRATPVLTTDGRFLLTADILTAIVPGGYLHDMWAAADQAALLPSVEVVPIADAMALLPPPVVTEPIVGT